MAERPLPAYTGDKPHVFVSYSHDDTRIVSREIRWLQDQGFNVWWDEGISPGSSWSQALAEEIEGCSLFLLFVSPSAVASDNCHREVAFALDTHRAFLAVHLEHTDLPSGWKLNIGDKQAIIRDRLSFEEYRHRLADGVKKHVLTAPVPESSVDAESRRPFLTTLRR